VDLGEAVSRQLALEVSWQVNRDLIPSRNEVLLAGIVGKRVASIRHYSDVAPAALLNESVYSKRGVRATQLFSVAPGPIVVTVSDGTSIAFGGSEELYSVTVEASIEEDEWPYAISATDPAHSEPGFSAVIGRCLRGIRVLQLEVSDRAGHHMSPSLLERPREAGVVLELDDGTGLLISQNLLDAPADLGIFLADSLSNLEVGVHDLCRITAPRIPLVRIGFFRELRHSKPDGPSLKDSLRAGPQLYEENIIRYLRAGKVLMMAPGVVSDVLDPSKGIITSLSIVTDGRFAWRSDLAYYVERYHLALPNNFVAHMRDNGWAVPASIDLQSLELA
jgi:hypothetical protein